MATIYSFRGLLFEVLLVSLILASTPAEGQNLKNLKLKVSIQNMPLDKALNVLSEISGFAFTYRADEIDNAKTVSIDVENESFYSILERLGKEYSLNFNRVNDQIVVRKAEVIGTNEETVVENGSLSGRITDAASKEPLQGVTVTLRGTTLGTYTNKGGYYTIDNIKPGKYTVAASYVGYAASAKEITISSGKTTEANFQLGESVVNLDEVTVTGSLSERTVRASANPVATLTEKELDVKNLTFLSDALVTLPGISTTVSGDGVNNYGLSSGYNAIFNIRGTVTGTANSPSTKIYVDGVEIFSTESLNYLDPNQIERIEVSKGPMSSTLYGAGSSAGVVQIFTKKGKGDTKIDFKSMYTVRDDKYAFDNPISQQYSLGVSGGKGDFGYKLSTSYSMFPIKRYELNNEIDEQTYGLNGNVYGNIGKIRVQFGFNYSSMKKGNGVSNNSYMMALKEGWENPEKLKGYTSISDIISRRISTDMNLNIKHIITDNIFQNLTLGTSGYGTEDDYRSATTSATYRFYKSEFEKQTAKYFINWAQTVFDDFSVDIKGGLDYRRTKYSMMSDYYTSIYNEIAASRSGTSSNTISVISTKGIFSEGVWGYKNNLFLTTGFRTERDDSYGDNTGWYSMSRFGLTYVIPVGEFTFKPRVAYGKSTESVDPQYKVDRVSVSGSYYTYYVGNPDIQPQTQDGYETGVDMYYTKNYSLSFTLFYQRVRNKVMTDYTKPDAYTTVYTYSNIGQIDNKGFEISLRGVMDPLTLDVNYSYTDSRYKGGFDQGTNASSYIAYRYNGGRVVNIPSTTIFSRLTYRIPEFLSLCEKRGSVSLEASYKGHWLVPDYYNYYKTYCETGKYNSSIIKYYQEDNGYVLFNLNFSYPVINEVLLYADVRNVLNYQKVTMTFSAISGRVITFGCRVAY